jgi:hypothetical protein
MNEFINAQQNELREQWKWSRKTEQEANKRAIHSSWVRVSFYSIFLKKEHIASAIWLNKIKLFGDVSADTTTSKILNDFLQEPTKNFSIEMTYESIFRLERSFEFLQRND